MKDSCPRSQEGVHGEVEITAEHAPESKMDLTLGSLELELRLVGPGAVVCLCMFAEYRSRCAVVAMVRGGEHS